MFAYYEDQLESAVTGTQDDEKEEIEKDDSFHLNSTISLMWICITLLSLPSLIIWMKNPRYSLFCKEGAFQTDVFLFYI